MSTVIANPDNGGLIERPKFVDDLGGSGQDLAHMRQYMKPSRIKVIQKTSGDVYKSKFRDGDIIIEPQMIKIGDTENEFNFTPLIMFPTFIAANPYGVKPFIAEMSFDDKSDIAKKARAFIKTPYPGKQNAFITYGQVLNFLVRVHGIADLPNTPLGMIFRSAEYKTGQILLGLIEDRRARAFLCKFSAHSQLVQHPNGSYYGLSIRNSPEPWIQEDLVLPFKQQNEELKKMLDDRLIEIDMDATDVEQDASSESKF